MRWYLNRTGVVEGPFDEPTILGMIGRGEVQPPHQVCVEGSQEWQPLSSHAPFGQATAPSAPPGFDGPTAPAIHAPASEAAGGFGHPANAFAAAAGGSAQAPIVTAPSTAAPGEGFFERAKAEGKPPSEAAKNAAGMAHLLASLGTAVGCWACGLGGVAGAFVGNVLYKETPKDPHALFHINQAVTLQVALWLANVVAAILFTVLRIVGAMISDSLGFALSFLHLVNLLLWSAAVILPILQARKAKAGEWNQYPVIGARVMRQKEPMLK